MSRRDQFRQYAEEAMLSASRTENERDVKALMDLAHVWALAAFESERPRHARRRYFNHIASSSPSGPFPLS